MLSTKTCFMDCLEQSTNKLIMRRECFFISILTMSSLTGPWTTSGVRDKAFKLIPVNFIKCKKNCQTLKWPSFQKLRSFYLLLLKLSMNGSSDDVLFEAASFCDKNGLRFVNVVVNKFDYYYLARWKVLWCFVNVDYYNWMHLERTSLVRSNL